MGWAKINRTMNFVKRDLNQTLVKKPSSLIVLR